jgi:hypothetical protein
MFLSGSEHIIIHLDMHRIYHIVNGSGHSMFEFEDKSWSNMTK